MTTVYLAPTFGAGYQGFTNGGLPLNAGLIYTFIAGGTTPKETYTTSAATVQNANPIVLDASGRTPSEVWFVSGFSYRIDLKDSAGNLLKTYDNLPGTNDPTATGFIQFLQTTGLGTVSSNGQGTIGTTAAGGVNIKGKGSVNDVSLLNSGGTSILTIPTGSNNVVMNATGILIAANGAVGSPSVQFAAGATTGLYSTGATSFAVAIAGVQTVVWGTAGQIIGTYSARATTDPTNSLTLSNGTAPVGTGTDECTLYVTAGEMRVMDAAGNATLLSPHDGEYNWVHHCVKGNGAEVLYRMELMADLLEEKFGADFLAKFGVPFSEKRQLELVEVAAHADDKRDSVKKWGER